MRISLVGGQRGRLCALTSRLPFITKTTLEAVFRLGQHAGRHAEMNVNDGFAVQKSHNVPQLTS